MSNTFKTRDSVAHAYNAKVSDMRGQREWRKSWRRSAKRAESREFGRYLRELATYPADDPYDFYDAEYDADWQARIVEDWENGTFEDDEYELPEYRWCPECRSYRCILD